MHVTLRELRDDIAAEQRSKDERREEEAREAAGASRKEILSTTSGTSSRVASAAHSRLSSNTNNMRPNTRGSNVPGSAPFVVRVRGSTLRDVKQAASTLKSSLNLLKIGRWRPYCPHLHLLARPGMYASKSIMHASKNRMHASKSIMHASKNRMHASKSIMHASKNRMHALKSSPKMSFGLRTLPIIQSQKEAMTPDG